LKIVPAVLLPQINVTATDATATEAGTTTGQFTITSDQAAGAGGLAIAFSLSGTAITTDYTIDASPAIITPGNTSVLVTVTPVDDALIEGDETINITAVPGADYTVGAANAATITLHDDDSAPAYINFDPAFIGPNLSMTAPYLTVTSDATVSFGETRSVTSRNSGKYAFENKLDSSTSAAFFNMGFVNINAGVANYVGSDANGFGYLGDGYKTNSGSTNIGLPIVVGDTVMMLLDFDNQEVSIIIADAAPLVLWTGVPIVDMYAAVGGRSSEVSTANLGASSFINTLPAGYTSWDGSQSGAQLADTLDPANKHALVTLSNGDLTSHSTSQNWYSVTSIPSKAAGKFYCEITVVNATQNISLGLIPPTDLTQILTSYSGATPESYGYITSSGVVYNGNSVVATLPASNTNGDVVGIMVDFVANELRFIIGGIAQTAISILAGEYYLSISTYNGSSATVNFGASAFTTTIPGGYDSWDGSQAG
jgi:hypothetical protein